MRIRDEYLHGSDLTGVVKKIEVTIGTGNNANKSVIKYIKADSEGGVVEVPIGDITGKAATASKLDNTSAIGSKINPVYFTDKGVPSACIYSLNATVPAGAANQVLYYSAANTLGTQSYTTLTSNLDVFTVATSSAAGKKGLVPAPSANQLGAGNFFLRADGIWTVIENKTASLNGTNTSLVTTGEKYNWNSAYNWYNSMTSGDTDGIINKWKEVEAFLANYGDSSTLAAELAKLVTLSTDQTITGVKTFSEVINGSITGNAGTANKLKNTVNINGVAFDGSTDITITAAANGGNAATAGSAIKSDYLTTRYIGSNGDTVAQVKLKILDSYTSLSGKQGYSILVNSEFMNNYPLDDYIIPPGGVYSLTYLTPGYDGKIYGQWLASYLGSTRLYVFGRDLYLWTERKTIAWTSDIPTSLPANGGNADTATKLQTARTIWGLSFDGTGNVNGNLTLGNDIIYGSNSRNAFQPSGTDLYIGSGYTASGDRTFLYGNVIRMYTGTGSQSMYINSSGGVTIGDSDKAGTDTKLFVNGKAIFSTDVFFYNWAYMRTYLNDGSEHSVIGVNNNILFINDGKTVPTIIRGGNVGIGTTTPSYKLDVNGKIYGSDLYIGGHLYMKFGGSWLSTIDNDGNGPIFGYQLAENNRRAYYVGSPVYICGGSYGNYENGITVNSSNNVGIGTTSPSYKLHVVGDIYTTTGFKKEGSSDSYVLLGGGGHKKESSLSVNYATSSRIAIESGYLTSRYIGSSGDTVAQVKLKILDSYTSLAGKQGYSILVNSQVIDRYSDDNYVINPSSTHSLTYLTPWYDGKEYGQWLAACLGSERLFVFGRNNNLWTERKTIAWTSDIPTNVSSFTNDAKYLTSHAYSYGSIDIYDVNGAKKTSNNTVSASVNTETLRLQEGDNIAITATNSGDPGSDIIKIAVTGIESNINQNGYGQLALWRNGASSVSATLQSATYNETLTVKAGSGIDFSGVNGTANNDVWTISAIPYNCAITLNNNSTKSLIKDSWSADKDSVYLTSNGTSGGTSLAAGTYALWIEDRSTSSGTPNYYSGTFTCAGSATAGRLDEIALHSSMATSADTNAPTRIFVATLISNSNSNTPGKHVLRFCSLDSKATPHYLTVKVNRII